LLHSGKKKGDVQSKKEKKHEQGGAKTETEKFVLNSQAKLQGKRGTEGQMAENQTKRDPGRKKHGKGSQKVAVITAPIKTPGGVSGEREVPARVTAPGEMHGGGVPELQ